MYNNSMNAKEGLVMNSEKKTAPCGTFLWAWIIGTVILSIIFRAIDKTGESLGSTIAISALIGFMIGIVAFCFKMAVVTSKVRAQAKRQHKADMQNGITRYDNLVHVGGLNVPENINCNAILNPTELIISCSGNEFVLPIEKIRNVECEFNIDEKQYLKSSMAKGIIGAATFGVAGAVIGSAPETKTKREIKCYAIISYDGTDGEVKTFILRDGYPNIEVCKKLVELLKGKINTRTNRVEL